MILPDMTSEQMLKVLEGDKKALNDFADSYMAQEGIRILRSKQTRFPCSLTKFCIAPESHQRYLLNFRIASRREAFEGGRRFYVRAIINTSYGTEAANILYHRENDTMSVVYFRAHLFQRYAERMGMKMQGDDIIRTFTKRNPIMIEATKWRTKHDCMMLCHDGACFGEVNDDDPNLIYLKTFISTELMQDETYRAKLNGDFDAALCGAYWDVYFHDPEMAAFIMKTTKSRKSK